MKKKFGFNKDILLFILLLLGISFTLIYIFYTSTALITSESVITDVIINQQRINKEIILSHWYYGNELWLFSFSLPTLFFSFFIKNSIIVRKISIFIATIIFFFVLYQYGKKFLNKKENYILLIIFLTGISYSALDYFYAFSSCLTMIIHSMILLYLYYKSIEEKNNREVYYIASLILTFLFGICSFKYFPLVIVPFLITEMIRNRKSFNYKKIGGILLVGIMAFIIFQVLTTNYKSLGELPITDFTNFSFKKRINSLGDMVFRFFGYDNQNNAISVLAGEQYFVDNSREYSLLSIRGITDFIKVIASIIFMVIAPIALYKNYKNNKKEINFLLVFSTTSWFFMILYYFFFQGFTYSAIDLRYFLFNFIINIILGLYFLYHCFSKFKLYSFLCNVFIISYIISNLYTTGVIIKENNDEAIEKKQELVKVLKANDLNFGYGGYYNSLMVNYLSNYEITVANVKYKSKIIPYQLNSDERWYNRKGRVFFIFDENSMYNYVQYEKRYGKEDEVLITEGFVILVYNKNPLAK